MARPRKNPDDPKWNVGTYEQVPTNEAWNMCFVAALGGLIGRGGLSTDQMIKTAKTYADAAYTEIKDPLK